MTVASPAAAAETRDPVEPLDGSGTSHRRRRFLVGVVAIVVLALGASVAVTDPFDDRSTPKTAVVDNASATSFATVTRQTLSAQTQVDATLGYAGAYDIVNQARGTFTALPAVGQVVKEGDVLYEVDGAPVLLFYGSTPAYRTLAEGTAALPTTGPDVEELNADLVALGYATRSELDPSSDTFTTATKTAVERLQTQLGVTKNGTLTLGQVAFMPTAMRITALGTNVGLGTPAQPGAEILQATSPDRIVTIALDAGQQAEVKAGDAVTITLPDQRATPGVVWSVGTVATAGTSGGTGSASAPTIEVDVIPTDPAATGRLDQAPVTVAITTAIANDALVVPVNALLALGSGGYAVEEITGVGSHHLVSVTLGLFDDARGLVQVGGSALHAGQRIVVPAT